MAQTCPAEPEVLRPGGVSRRGAAGQAAGGRGAGPALPADGGQAGGCASATVSGTRGPGTGGVSRPLCPARPVPAARRHPLRPLAGAGHHQRLPGRAALGATAAVRAPAPPRDGGVGLLAPRRSGPRVDDVLGARAAVESSWPSSRRRTGSSSPCSRFEERSLEEISALAGGPHRPQGARVAAADGGCRSGPAIPLGPGGRAPMSDLDRAVATAGGAARRGTRRLASACRWPGLGGARGAPGAASPGRRIRPRPPERVAWAGLAALRRGRSHGGAALARGRSPPRRTGSPPHAACPSRRTLPQRHASRRPRRPAPALPPARTPSPRSPLARADGRLSPSPPAGPRRHELRRHPLLVPRRPGAYLALNAYWLAAVALFRPAVERAHRTYATRPVAATLVGLVALVPVGRCPRRLREGRASRREAA